MTGFPLRYARANVLLGPGGEAAAVYRLGMVAYPFLPAAEKWRQLRLLERWAAIVGADFSLYRVARAFPADRYTTDTAQLLDARGQPSEAFGAYLAGQELRLSQLAAHLPELYAVVVLGEPAAGGLGAGLVRSADRARRRVEALTGVGAGQPIGAGELEALAVAEQRVFDQLAGVLPCERATTRQLQWLLRRVELRGLGEPELDPHWEPDALVLETPDGQLAYRPLEHDLWRCCNAPLTEPRNGPARLVVESERGESHQAFLMVGELSDAPEFPGPMAELLFAPLEGVRFPVDAVVHARWVGNRDALAQVRRRITDVEQVYRDQTEGDIRGPGLLAEEDRLLAREYEAVLQGSAHPPMLYASIGYALGAPDAEELERRVTGLRDQFGDIRLYRPRGLQATLYADHLPRPDGGAVRDYVSQVTVEQLAALMPHGTVALGAEHGIYIGVSGGAAGRPVKYDPTAPSRQARTSAVLLAGTLGSGKTVAAQAIAYAAERRGSSVVDFDPKPDHGFDRVRQLDGRVDVLALSGAEQHRGALDPLAIGLEDLREELASSYYLDLLRDPPPSWENQIQRAVRELVRRGERSSLAIIDQLRTVDHEAARDVADALEVVADFGLARLGFGDGSRPDVGAAASPVTTIRTPGLTLPDPRASRETYTRSERVSVATLSLVAAYALRLVAGDRTRHKVVLLDEAWFLLASTQGRSLVNRLVRLGRAFNATVLLATQRLDDLGDLSDLVGTYFVFGQESDSEAEQALRLLGLDPADRALVARLRSYRQGLCLMRDLDGRVGELQFDLAPDLLAALDTTPKAVVA
ncbi:MAG TPA: ATP-binding protein [Conexibacter sp.]|nr:ATP-binding protein [Conexibacter sp.]